ncbi:hypothetical protein [Carboxylicivirga sp. RSCT41]|uniref:hypothetical protein n=1 Tax=Carboxylicivirga agarovorans TaxID=3417570 RepID=UPI003D3545AB
MYKKNLVKVIYKYKDVIRYVPLEKMNDDVFVAQLTKECTQKIAEEYEIVVDKTERLMLTDDEIVRIEISGEDLIGTIGLAAKK